MDNGIRKEAAENFPPCFVSGDVDDPQISKCPDRDYIGGVMSRTVFLCRNPNKRTILSGLCPRDFIAPPFEKDSE